MDRNLLEKISEYKEFKWKSLLRKELGQYSLEEVGTTYDKLKSFFDFIIDYSREDRLPIIYEQQLLNQLNNLFSFSREIYQFQNLAERQNWINRVKSFEMEVWNGLNGIIDYIKFNQKVDDINLQPYLTKIEDAAKLADEIIKRKEGYEKAAEIADNWIKTEGRAVSASLKEKSDIFDLKAVDDHRSGRTWGWFIISIVGMLSAIGLIVFFIIKSGTDITVGAALLRISTLLVISYFSFFCLQQFSNHRKLYEVYKFKAIALKTIDELYKSYSNDHAAKQKILDKGIGIIFSDPVSKEGSQLQQRFVDSMLDIIKNKIS